MLATVRRIAGVVITIAIVSLASCSPNDEPLDHRSTRPRTTAESGPDFSELIANWHTTAATIVYRTEANIPGQPASTHQCLRQMVGGAIDRQEGLRMCSRQGRLELAWDPPDRWRMDVVTPLTSYRLVSIAGRTIRCEREASCRDVTSATAAVAPFGSLLAPDLGANDIDAVIARPPAEVAGIEAWCFAATEGDRREWCFSDDGLLLSLLGGKAGDWTVLEAVSVSRQVDAAVFSPSST
jgi:hypothetical protein